MPIDQAETYPDSQSPTLILSHPTPEELIKISTNTAAAWKDSLSPSQFLEESHYLSNVPLAQDGAMTNWILVDKRSKPNARHILCSCETFRKRSLTSNARGEVKDSIVHGVASVFCPPEFRRRGYAARMMEELAIVLRTWQDSKLPCVASILYSDIGKTFYANLGWKPVNSNTDIEFTPKLIPSPTISRGIQRDDLAELCKRDEAMVRGALASLSKGAKERLVIVPDVNHMLWHIAKENFACERIFNKIPTVHGAIVGQPGNQVWVIWTRRYYSHPNDKVHDNVLYILRLVVEVSVFHDSEPGEDNYDTQILRQNLRAVLEAAQDQAARWELDIIKLWDPPAIVLELLKDTEFDSVTKERETESVASLLWYSKDSYNGVDVPAWQMNEHYAWC
ncbi:hypothetical protein BU24DRAFT_14678 [Aaosphaeria arxii CBS 175.79]|uniref:LYC1 C-terminal domain-containing protein n=1 Tax=Aaosphaeria arxii CBS 175.79 TaxID=1450172 RepID=A0A6A5Y6B1_9PLEO|nr:uncharacterized protein BU24DRAFT_14678 [Aaosphaeria arxii CBS 175.79]KAF2021095.1 hypothetical protein BU24DRAFT_14678 [Aaosphaeria arxii CBS 175.79]